MSILTVELPAELVSRLEAISGGIPDAKARLVEEALKAFLDASRPTLAAPASVRPGSALERAGDLVGSVEGPGASIVEPRPFPDGKSAYDIMKDLCGVFDGPGDLSTNPKYMEGFGEE